MKKGIKHRLVWSYLLLIIFTVVLFETIILTALFVYYHEGMKQTLRDQGKMFISFYEQELSGNQYEEHAQDYLSRYRFLVNAHVQLVDLDGNIIAETVESRQKNLRKYDDIQNARRGEIGYLSTEMDGEKTLSTSVPLMVGGKNEGIIRFTTSLEQLQNIFIKNAIILVSVGVVVICLALILSFFLAHTITRPVRLITQAAEKMAEGEFSIRVDKEKDDEIGQLADTLNFMAEQVQKHEQIKNEFIAAVSHDLRTPLTSVKGWSVTLHSISDDPFIKEGLEIISDESDRLTSMVSDLLDLSSLSSGKFSLALSEVSILSLITNVVQQLKPRAENKGVSLSTKLIASTSGITVLADDNRLRQVFINLIDNSIKFTPKGGKILVEWQKTESEVVVSIHDTGVGMGSQQLMKVKDKFVRGKGKGAGTGLGLAICEEIIKLHSGTLVIDSEEGKGTTVHVRLPR